MTNKADENKNGAKEFLESKSLTLHKDIYKGYSIPYSQLVSLLEEYASKYYQQKEGDITEKDFEDIIMQSFIRVGVKEMAQQCFSIHQSELTKKEAEINELIKLRKRDLELYQQLYAEKEGLVKEIILLKAPIEDKKSIEQCKDDMDFYWDLHDIIYNNTPAHEPDVTDLEFQNVTDKVFSFIKGYDYIHEKQ